MRKFISLLLLLNLVLAPVASGVAVAMGGTGEHLHYDRSWHSVSEINAIAAHFQAEHVEADHMRGEHVDHGHALGFNHDRLDGGSGPLKHTHCDQAHLASFVLPMALMWIAPETPRDLTPANGRLPFNHKSYPPFRPPQAA